MAEEEEIAVDFSLEELFALARALEQPVLPGLGPVAQELATVVNDEVLEAAWRSLVARGVVAIDDDGVERVNPSVVRILDIASAPGLLAHVHYETVGRLEQRVFAAVPSVSVEHRPLIDGVHRLIAFDTDEFLLRIIRVSHLEDRTPALVEPFVVSLRALVEAGLLLGGSDTAAATNTLLAAVPRSAEASVRVFAVALNSKAGAGRVVLVHRPSENVVSGGDISWIDCRDAGLWLVPVPDLDGIETMDETEREELLAQELEIRPTTQLEIITELATYLPRHEDPAENMSTE